MTTLYTEKHKAALDADHRWQRMLIKAFGKRAGDMRYRSEGKGKPGTALRMVYELRMAAQEAWHKEIDAQRA